MPEGDDPDSLVRRGGARALEEVLRQAVDVLERKIQILQRRGLFGSLPGRRRALDRLLPTIRAARDAITRELYLTWVADAARINRDALEREIADAGGGAGDRPDVAAAAALAAAEAPLPPTVEKWLLQLLVLGEPWRARVLEAVRAEDFGFPAYRGVFEAVAADAPDKLDEAGARAYELLRAEGLGPQTPDDLLAVALDAMEARRLSRKLAQIRKDLTVASDSEKLRSWGIIDRGTG
jgi:DNA primase